MIEVNAISNFIMPYNGAGFPSEYRNVLRSDVRLLSINPGLGTYDMGKFTDMINLVGDNDLLVFNDSQMVRSSFLGFIKESRKVARINLGYSRSGLIGEIRTPDAGVSPGTRIHMIDGSTIELSKRVAAFPRFWQIAPSPDFDLNLLRQSGDYITYQHMPVKFGDEIYANVFATKPGSVEYPSASRPFTEEIINKLKKKRVEFDTITLKCNLASLDASEFSQSNSLLDEYYQISERTADHLNISMDSGKRIIAVGTSVVRALETSHYNSVFRAGKGYTNLFIRPDTMEHLDGIITGMHDPTTSHLLMLGAFADIPLIRSAYMTAAEYGFAWHEFGDSCIILS